MQTVTKFQNIQKQVSRSAVIALVIVVTVCSVYKCLINGAALRGGTERDRA